MSPDSTSGTETAVLVTPPATRRRRPWLLPVAVLVIAALVAGVWYAWPKAADAPGGPGAAPAAEAAKAGAATRPRGRSRSSRRKPGKAASTSFSMRWAR